MFQDIASMHMINDSVIMSIPSIRYIKGGLIFGEIDNIHSFSHSGKLLAFAGLGSSVYQSGNLQAKRSHGQNEVPECLDMHL